MSIRQWDLSPQQKAAHITSLLRDEGRYTTAEIAEMYGVTTTGARLMMYRISCVLPLLQNEQGEWMLMPNSSGSNS